MLPWFIYILILIGYIQTPEDWNHLTPTEQQNAIIIVDDTMNKS